MIARRHNRASRTGIAAVEFAIVLPVLMFFFGTGVDFARAFYANLIITNASRNAALYGCNNPTTAADTVGIQNVALTDTTDLGSSVTVTSSTFTDTTGTEYVQVGVSYPFTPITPFAGFTSSLTLNQSTTMRVEPTTPRPGSYSY